MCERADSREYFFISRKMSEHRRLTTTRRGLSEQHQAGGSAARRQPLEGVITRGFGLLTSLTVPRIPTTTKAGQAHAQDDLTHTLTVYDNYSLIRDTKRLQQQQQPQPQTLFSPSGLAYSGARMCSCSTSCALTAGDVHASSTSSSAKLGPFVTEPGTAPPFFGSTPPGCRRLLFFVFEPRSLRPTTPPSLAPDVVISTPSLDPEEGVIDASG